MTEAKNPEVGLLDRDRIYRLNMHLGSKALLERLETFHPRVVQLLREKNMKTG